MKTSNKLLLGALIVIFIGITALMVYLKTIYNQNYIEGKGEIVRKERTVKDFSCLEVRDNATILITEGDSQKVAVETNTNIEELVKTDVEGNCLNITTDKPISPSSKPKIHITIDTLRKIDISGRSELETVTEISWGTLELNVSAGADVKLSGELKKADIQCSSGAWVNAGDLRTEVADIEASSGGDVEIHVTKELVVSASSGSEVTFSGDPEMKQINISSGADLEKE